MRTKKGLEVPPAYKVFNGKRYTRNVFGLAKWSAESHASKIRKDGVKARVVLIRKVGMYAPREGYYAVYVRK